MTQAAVPGQTGSGGTETQNFCYDEQNRLVYGSNSTATPPAGNGTCGTAAYQQRLGGTYTSSYVYTHLGQLWQGPYNGKGAYQYLYCNTSQPHQLTSVYPTNTNCANTSGKTQSYGASYDSWGNMTTRTTTGTTGTLTYDPQDLLVRWNGSTNNQAEWYMYDGSGSRVLRRSFDGTNTTITVYAFGMEEHQYQYSGSGTTATNTGNTYYYMLGGRLLGTLSGTGTLSTTFMLTDTLGSVVASMSNTAGSAAVLGNQAYGPYGNQRYVAGSLGTSKGYTGQYNDSLTGLDYYNARYYDPVVGRFLSADVVQGNVQGMDPYAYVGGNPETYTDPTGSLLELPGEEGGVGNYAGGDSGGGVGGDGGSSDVTVTSGDTSDTYNSSSDSVTETVTNPDGSSTTTELNPGDPGYDNAIDSVDGSGSGPEAVNSLTPRGESSTTTEPSTTSTEPSTTNTEPSVTPTEPSTTSTEPGVTPTEPRITATTGNTIEAGDGGHVSNEPRVVSNTDSSEPEGQINWRDDASSLNNAPKFTSPGTSSIDGVHVNDLGQGEPYTAYYDEYGRQIGRTDYTGGNSAAGIEPIHSHAFTYLHPDYPNGISLPGGLDHAPGEFSELLQALFWLL